MIKNKYILGHRGYSEIAPENTKLAFDAAYLFKFDGIEMDLHQTKDNQLVVIHDEKIDRTCNGVGNIKNLTYEEIKKYNYAFKFNKNLPKQNILLYEDFLKMYHDKFKILNVEIKTNINTYSGIEKNILSVHKKVNPKCQIIYSSFNFESLKNMRDLNKQVELGFLFVDSLELNPIISEVKKVCQYLHPWFKSLTNKKELSIYNATQLPMNIWSFDKRNVKDKWTKGSNKLFEEILYLENVYSLICNSRF